MSSRKCEMSKRPRIACYFANDRDKVDVSQRMEAVRIQLVGRLGAATYSDVLEELLNHYEGCLETSFADKNQPAADSKQIMVERPDPEGQLHICEEQQLRLLVDEVTRRCPKCHKVAWRKAK